MKVFHPYDLGLGAQSGMDRDGMDLLNISTFEHCTWGDAFLIKLRKCIYILRIDFSQSNPYMRKSTHQKDNHSYGGK